MTSSGSVDVGRRQPSLSRRGVRAIRTAVGLRVLPARVGLFYWRARRAAARAGDRFTLDSATRPAELAALLRLASGHRAVVELGTGTAWTAIALALADRHREVVTYDPTVRRERDLYLRLVSGAVRSRIRFVAETGEAGAASGGPVDLLFVDSSHGRDETIAEFEAWRPRLRPGAIVAFHDYENPSYPGVAQAVGALGLGGKVEGSLFVWRAGSS